MPVTVGICSFSNAIDILSDTLNEQGVIDEANKIFEKYPNASQVLLYSRKRYNIRTGVYEEYEKLYLLDKGCNKIYRCKENLIIYY